MQKYKNGNNKFVSFWRSKKNMLRQELLMFFNFKEITGLAKLCVEMYIVVDPNRQYIMKTDRRLNVIKWKDNSPQYSLSLHFSIIYQLY